MYGSPFSNINLANRMNKNLLFDIDWKGARKLEVNLKKIKLSIYLFYHLQKNN